jgi:radical SAM protein with 4Fe4S-binding SPASM domain
MDIVANFNKIRISMYGVSKATYESVHKGLQFETVYNNLEYLLNNKGNCRVEVYFLQLWENDHETEQFIRRYASRAYIWVWRPHNWIDGRTYRDITGPKKSCGRPQTGPLQIQWDGKVVPCCWDYNSSMVMGDITKQTVEEILNSEPFEKLRHAHKTENFKEYPCDICDQLHKRNDVLIYTNIEEASVGKTNTGYDRLN